MHKILLVEDDKLIRDELETLLVNAGFSVRSVEDFDNTLEHIREEMPDLLLLDINLPGQNGLGKVPPQKRKCWLFPRPEKRASAGIQDSTCCPKRPCWSWKR